MDSFKVVVVRLDSTNLKSAACYNENGELFFVNDLNNNNNFNYKSNLYLSTLSIGDELMLKSFFEFGRNNFVIVENLTMNKEYALCNSNKEASLKRKSSL